MNQNIRILYISLMLQFDVYILDSGACLIVNASFGKCTRTSTVAGGSRVLGLMTTSSGDIATRVPMVGLA